MMFRYLSLLPILAFSGCGPSTSTTPSTSVARTEDGNDLAGTWRLDFFEVPPDVDVDDLNLFKSSEFTTTGDLIRVLVTGIPNPVHLKMTRDGKSKPKTIVVSEVDDKGQPTLPAGRPPIELFGIYKIENDLLSVAVSRRKETQPKEFRPASDESDWTTIVLHLRKK